MKGGPCGDVFRAWERCVFTSKAKGESFIQNCQKPTMALKFCTEEHPDYYADVLSGDGGGDDEDSARAEA